MARATAETTRAAYKVVATGMQMRACLLHLDVRLEKTYKFFGCGNRSQYCNQLMSLDNQY